MEPFRTLWQSYASIEHEKVPVKGVTMTLGSVYTYEVARKVTIRRPDLGELLQQLRGTARMSREQLAEAGELSVGPIKRIETEGHVPKPGTLQQIAEGLATYAPERRDDEL